MQSFIATFSIQMTVPLNTVVRRSSAVPVMLI